MKVVTSVGRWVAHRWPHIAQKLESSYLYRWLGMSTPEQTAWVEKALHREGRVIDVGIGANSPATTVYARYPALTVIGVDRSRTALQYQQAALDHAGIVNVHLVCAAPHALPFSHDQFEQVVTFNLFQRTMHSLGIVDDLLRVALDGATLVGTTVVEIKDEPRSWIYSLSRAWQAWHPVQVEGLHELLGTTWSKLQGQRSGAVYAFHRPQLDRMTGQLLYPEQDATSEQVPQ